MTRQKPPKSAAPAACYKPETRAKAMELLAAGNTVSAVAADCAVRRDTIRTWRDSPDGQRLLDAARAARALAAKEAADAALRVLREGAQLAATRLVDAVRRPGGQSIAAAREILGRVGVPMVDRVESTDLDRLDLSQLTDGELAEFERLHAKVRRAT